MLLVFGYLPLVVQNLTPYVLPIGFLLAVVSTYGRLAAENEWTAIQMAGIRPLKMFLPAVMMALVFGVGMYGLVSSVLPTLKRQEKEFLVEAVRTSIVNLSPGRSSIQIGGFSLTGVRDGELFREAFLRKPGNGDDPPLSVLARTVLLRVQGDELLIEMEDVKTVGPEVGARVTTAHLEWRFDLSSFVKEDERSYTSPRYKTSADLRRALAAGDVPPDQEHRVIYELHNRYAMSVILLMFLGLGAPTGLILRRGTRLGALAISVGYALAYYLLSMRLGKQLAMSQGLPPEVAAWSTTSLGFAVGAVLLRKATRR
jgi:lipopolysaccharide export system permease protein